MVYKKCAKCDLNYVMNDIDGLCSECQKEDNISIKKPPVDNNKHMVERDLLPILRGMTSVAIKSLTVKQESYDLLGLRLPLLVECGGHGGESCKREIIKDESKTYRYYIQPYDINGKKYHICSQWWSVAGNNSKDILKLLKEIKI